MRSFVIALAAVLLTAVTASAEISPASSAANNDYPTAAGRKLGRGIGNVAFGWMDILKGIEEVGGEQNPLAALTWGPIYGIGKAVTRTAVGAYEVATFPVPVTGNFDPVLEPEFVLEERRH